MTSAELFPLWLSLRVAAVSTLFVVVAGVGLAWLLARGRFRGREALAVSQRDAATLVLELPVERVGLVASVAACCATYAAVLA